MILTVLTILTEPGSLRPTSVSIDLLILTEPGLILTDGGPYDPAEFHNWAQTLEPARPTPWFQRADLIMLVEDLGDGHESGADPHGGVRDPAADRPVSRRQFPDDFGKKRGA